MTVQLTPALPEELQVEVTGACNLRCRMCLVRYAPALGRREGALDYEQFIALVDSLPRLRKLTLQGLGEPLLSPHLLAMVRHACGRGARVGFNTNGVLLDRAIAADLIDAGLAWLHVSLDGATAPVYEDVRHGTTHEPQAGQFERVVANLRQLVALRHAAGSQTPRVQIVFVAMRRNIDELPRLVELAADIGVEEVFVQNLSHDFGDADGSARYRALRRYVEREALFDRGVGAASAQGGPSAQGAAIFAQAAHRARELGLPLRLPRLEPRRDQRASGQPGCGWPWESAYVTHAGEVQPCCMVMGSERARLGSLHEQGFAQIWHGERYRRFREQLLGDEPPRVCRGCSLYRGLF